MLSFWMIEWVVVAFAGASCTGSLSFMVRANHHGFFDRIYVALEPQRSAVDKYGRRTDYYLDRHPKSKYAMVLHHSFIVWHALISYVSCTNRQQ